MSVSSMANGMLAAMNAASQDPASTSSFTPGTYAPIADPPTASAPIANVRQARLEKRFLTPAGTTVKLPVTATATTVTWTFARAEQNTKYGIVACPNWGTTVYVVTTDKTTSTVKLTFGTAAPANATVDVVLFRSED